MRLNQLAAILSSRSRLKSKPNQTTARDCGSYSFIGIGSFEKLRERFYIRNTETYDAIEARIRRVKEDMSYAKYFDLAVNNPLDGSEKYIAGILDTAHDFYLRIIPSCSMRRMKV